MFIAYNIPPDSKNPALAEDIFSDKEPYGDYFYYVACDDEAVVQTGGQQSSLASRDSDENACINGARVHESTCVVLHEVSVAFQKESLSYAQSVIDDELSDSYDNFNNIRGPLQADSMSVKEFMALTPQFPKIQLQLANGDDWAAFVVFEQSDINALFLFLKVSDGRAIKVLTRCTSIEHNIGELIEPWGELVEKYKDMPLTVFSGANSR